MDDEQKRIQSRERMRKRRQDPEERRRANERSRDYYYKKKEEDPQYLSTLRNRNRKRREDNPEESRKYAQKYYQANREQVRERQRKQREENAEVVREYHRQYYHSKLKRDPKQIERRRNYQIKKNYGITATEYDRIKVSQNGMCANPRCSNSLEDLDHNHTTGKVREFLCQGCNQGIGCFTEDIGRMQGAIEYLVKHEGDSDAMSNSRVQ